MEIPSCKNKKFGHNFIGGVCLNGCGQSQVNTSGPKIDPVGVDVWQKYARIVFERTPTTNARSYFNEIVDPYMKYIAWDDSDGNLFRSHQGKVYMAIRNYWNKYHQFKTVQFLEWVKKKNCLHPMAVVSAFLETKSYGR
jgi:hypothetical protein